MNDYSRNLKSVDDIAKERNWSTKRVRKLIQEGLPVVQIGRQSLISPETLDEYLSDREAPKTVSTDICLELQLPSNLRESRAK